MELCRMVGFEVFSGSDCVFVGFFLETCQVRSYFYRKFLFIRDLL